MPELPEVEVSRMGIAPHLENKTVTQVVVRQPSLRWPIPQEVQQLVNQKVNQVGRRAKYLLIETDAGTAIMHLGMSGSLRVVDLGVEVQKHDHVDIVMSSGKTLRFNDPRRFGALLWVEAGADVDEHELLNHLGPEPFDEAFNPQRLFDMSRGRKVSIKQFIMDNKVVVGVGNIYANESLFLAGINPKTAAGKISLKRYQLLYKIVVDVLEKAIKQGGTTLKDFSQADGKPGYFAQQLNVYGRGGEDCPICETTLSEIRQGQRTTVYCTQCQK